MGVAFLAIYLCISILEFKLKARRGADWNLKFMYFYIRI